MRIHTEKGIDYKSDELLKFFKILYENGDSFLEFLNMKENNNKDIKMEYKDLEQINDNLSKTNIILQSQIDDLTSRLNSLENNINNLKSDIKKDENEIPKLNEDITKIKSVKKDNSSINQIIKINEKVKTTTDIVNNIINEQQRTIDRLNLEKK